MQTSYNRQLDTCDVEVYGVAEQGSSLKRHLYTNAAVYITLAALSVIIFSAALTICILQANNAEGGGGGDTLCTECFQSKPDDCGFVAFSFNPFSKELKDSRNYKIQYKGSGEKALEVATSTETVFRAILGDRMARAESLIFRWVRYAVANRNTTQYAISKSARRYRPAIESLVSVAQSYLESQQGSELDSHDGFDVVCATEYAINNFWSNLTKDQLQQLYLNYTSPNFDNTGGFQVWSTLYQEIGDMYGTSVAVFKPDLSRRAVDLNLWNLKKNGIYLRRVAHADTGEFISPGWKYPSEFAGVILHPPRASPMNFSAPLSYDPIVFAFFEISYDDITYILVLDGHMINTSLSYCIEKEDDGYFYHCVFPPWEYGNPFPAFPTPLRERYRTIGFITACSSDDPENCKPPKGLFDKYRSTTSQFTIPQNLVDYIQNTQWLTPRDDLMSLYFYPSNSTAVVGPQSEVDLF